jgi:hypothetical protein
MLMTDTRTKVQQLAAERGMAFNEFAARCLLRNLSYETAKDLWYGVQKKRGFNPTTKAIVAKIFHRPIEEVLPDD